MQPSAVFLALAPVGLVMMMGGCAKAKPDDGPAPAPIAAMDGGVAPAPAAKNLCTDGAHRRGDHWKVDCNVCRCGADGAILCSEFPCADRGPRDASRGDGRSSP